MTDIAAIKNFQIAFQLLEPPFNATAKLMQVIQTLNFSSVNCVQIKEGTYNPNNDYEWLWQSIPANEAPNFIFVQSPGKLCLTVLAPSPILSALPIQQVHALLLPPNSPAVVSNIYIEGRPSSSLDPMAQGVPIQYFAVMAQVAL